MGIVLRYLLVIAWCFELEGLDGMVLLLLDSF